MKQENFQMKCRTKQKLQTQPSSVTFTSGHETHQVPILLSDTTTKRTVETVVAIIVNLPATKVFPPWCSV